MNKLFNYFIHKIIFKNKYFFYFFKKFISLILSQYRPIKKIDSHKHITSNHLRSGLSDFFKLDDGLSQNLIDLAKNSNGRFLSYDKNSEIGTYYNLPQNVNSILLDPDPNNKDLQEACKEIFKNLKPYIEKSFNFTPVVDSIKIMYSRPGLAKGAQFFHRDWDGLNFLKIFCYLNDVDINNGPHQYVIGSHNNYSFFKSGRIDEVDIFNKYSNDKIRTISASAGTYFCENTFGYHRGLPLIDNERWMMVIRLSDFYTSYSDKDITKRKLTQNIYSSV